MEIKSITPEQRDKLRAALPKDATKPHPTKSYLTAIKPIYIVERLNDVFGVGKWKQESTVIKVYEEGMVVVQSKLKIPEYDIELEAFGGSDNGGSKSKGFDWGDSFKGACTDALTKMTSYLEIGIEIFKGNGNATPPKVDQQQNNNESQLSPQQPATPPVKPKEKALIVVNNDKYKAALGYLEKNGIKSWEKVKDGYTISKSDEAQLLLEAMDLINTPKQ